AELTCGSHKNPAITKTPANPSFCSMTDVLPAKLLWRTDPPCCNEERGAGVPAATQNWRCLACADWQRCIAASAQAAIVSLRLKARADRLSLWQRNTAIGLGNVLLPKAGCRAVAQGSLAYRCQSVGRDAAIGGS